MAAGDAVFMTARNLLDWLQRSVGDGAGAAGDLSVIVRVGKGRKRHPVVALEWNPDNRDQRIEVVVPGRSETGRQRSKT